MIKVPYVPDRQSIIPNAATLTMHGKLSGKIQHFQVDILAFLQKSNEVRGLLPPTPVNGDLRIANTSFVTGYGDDSTGLFEYITKPFLSINAAADSTGPGVQQPHRCIVVYPGDYMGDIDLSGGIREGCRILFMPGANVYGNITIGNGCYLDFSSGCTVTGNITDGGLDAVATICGCVDIDGTIDISGPNTVLNAEGHSVKTVVVQDGTLNLHFKYMKSDIASSITQLAGALNVYGLTSGILGGGAHLQGGSSVFKNCYFTKLIFLDGGTVVCRIVNCEFVCPSTHCINIDSGSLFMTNCERVESESSYAIIALGNAGSALLRNNYITVANSVNANQSAIRVDIGFSLVLDKNTIIGKGADFSVEGLSPTNIQSQYGNQSNKVTDPVNITETVDIILVNAAIL